MKRISPDKRWRWKRLTTERCRRRLQRYRTGPGAERRPHSKSEGKTRWPLVRAPKVFTLNEYRHRNDVIDFIGKVREHVLADGKVVLDFSATERMFADGTLLLVAELDRLRLHHGNNLCFRCRYPKNRLVEQVLQQVGILDIVRAMPRLSSNDFPENVRHWRFATANNVDGQKFEAVREGIEGKVAPALLRDFFAGVTEAMTNSVQHAYTEDRGDGVANDPALRRWWMFSQERDDHLSVVFCDTGIGIPRSMRDPRHLEHGTILALLRSLGLGAKEAELIKVALELRKSSTGASHRGRGLTEIRDVIRNSRIGHLVIHSNCGYYWYDGARNFERIEDFVESIKGTLIWWRVPLSEMRVQ